MSDHLVIIYDKKVLGPIVKIPLKTKVNQADAVYWLERTKELRAQGQDIGLGTGIIPAWAVECD